MVLDKIMIVAGIGCRFAVDAVQVEAAIDAALRNAGQGNTLGLIAAPLAKARESGIVGAAMARGVAIQWISQQELEVADARTVSRSTYAMKAMNVSCVAEAAALAGAGDDSFLLGPRTAIGPVTCALARRNIVQDDQKR